MAFKVNEKSLKILLSNNAQAFKPLIGGRNYVTNSLCIWHSKGLNFVCAKAQLEDELSCLIEYFKR